MLPLSDLGSPAMCGHYSRCWAYNSTKETPEFFERTGINIIDNKHKNKVCMMSDVRGKTGYRWGWEQVVILNRVVSLNLIEKVLF